MSWTGTPLDASSLALVVRDRNAGGFVHWVVTGIDPFVQGVGEGGLPENADRGHEQRRVSRLDSGRARRPARGVHNYEFALLALVDPVDLPLDTPAEEAAAAARGRRRRAGGAHRHRRFRREATGATVPLVQVAALVVAGIVVLLVAGVISYNRFVSQRQLIDNAWSNVDTELRRRYDLIPNLVRTVQGYAAHERTTLETVVQARSEAVARGRRRRASSRDPSRCWCTRCGRSSPCRRPTPT